ncbi:MAG: PD-(D/E)XK nuclease family protein [Prevotellaceae bacterium]|nr:PD-(D/E)XK nuclease family protein [Prevotellaceae bacterium]
MGKSVPIKSFIDVVSADLFDRYGADISKLCLVFPSRRAGLFFAESLSKLISQPLWQPLTLSISDLIYQWAGSRPSDTLRLIAELYCHWEEIAPSPTTFDQFYSWGETILRDFDQIDKYLVNPKALFQNLFDQKELEGDYSFLTPEQVRAVQMFRSSFQPQKTDLQESFTKMWALMYPLYERLKNSLEEQGLSYEGMLYRKVAEQKDFLIAKDSSILSYAFIGFNALNSCEREIFRHLQNRGSALFYWDRDDYYLNDTRQEAGGFIRENILDFPPADLGATYSGFSQTKEIETWSIPSDVLQTKIVPQIIRDNLLHTDRRTAVVLCDESLLIPLLSALPTVAENVNVTMGYPLSKTSLYSFIDALLTFCKSVRKHDSVRCYYHTEVSRLLAHPFIEYLCPNAAKDIKKQMIDSNLLYVPVTAFNADPLLYGIADFSQDPDTFLAFLSNLLNGVEDVVSQSDTPDPLLLPVLRHAVSLLNTFRTSLQSCRLRFSFEMLCTLLRKILRNTSIPFSGEPLQGIQVMGILETRTLDFEHIILLSAQEGFLPSTREAPSFIPYNLKIGFGLPVREEHEAMYAYYFYRLLQRAQKVSLLCGVGGDAMQSGERSRYLLQLLAESPHGPTIRERKLAIPITLPDTAPEIVKEKSGKCREQLMRYLDADAGRYLSPSAVYTYLQCNMRFYFQYVERIKEEQEVMEDTDGRGLGTVLHETMKSLYAPFEGRVVTKEALSHLLDKHAQIRSAAEEAIRSHFSPGSKTAHLFEQGRWLILADVIVSYAQQIIAYDKNRTPFTLIALEDVQKSSFLASAELSVPVGGIIDRIHEKDGVHYIVDYKTGKEQRSFTSIQSLFEEEGANQNSAVFQTFWYVMLYQDNVPLVKVLPSLYFVRSLFDHEASTLLYDKSSKSEVVDMDIYMDHFKSLLAHTLSQLFDLSLPFVQTKDIKHCTYCYYNQICRRETP